MFYHLLWFYTFIRFRTHIYDFVSVLQDKMSSVFESDSYGDVHRAFLQVLLDRGHIFTKDALALFQNFVKDYGFKLPEVENTPAPKVLSRLLHETLKIMNKKIKPLTMEIKQTFCEQTRSQVLVLVNRFDTPDTIRNMTDYNPTEKEFFSQLLKLIVESQNSKADIVDCLNLRNNLNGKKMTQHEVESLLERLISDYWIIEVDNKFTLHIRSVCELQPFLVDEFDMECCPSCQSVVLFDKDQTCGTCNRRSHRSCVERFAKFRKMPLACLHEDCKARWNNLSQNSTAPSQRKNVSIEEN